MVISNIKMKIYDHARIPPKKYTVSPGLRSAYPPYFAPSIQNPVIFL